LDALHAQAGIGALQVIYVGAGSRDGSPALASANGATVVSIDAFSFGAALNLGAQRAQHEVLVALSPTLPCPMTAGWRGPARRWTTPGWPARAATGGVPTASRRPRRSARTRRWPGRRPEWGYANGAGAFRAALWREQPFAVQMPGSRTRSRRFTGSTAATNV